MDKQLVALRTSQPRNATRAVASLRAAVLVCFAFLLGQNAFGVSTTYNIQSAFLSNVQPSFYQETFDSKPPNTDPGPSVLFGPVNGFTYTASAPFDLFYVPNPTVLGDILLSTNVNGQPITFSFTSNNITAVGGFFFLTDSGGNVVSGTLTLTLNDGTSVVLTNPTPTTFTGFTTSTGVPYTSLTITPSSGTFATVNDFIVGIAIPEPTTCVLSALGLLVVATKARRRR